MKTIVEQLKIKLEKQEDCMLVTVVARSGSAPGRKGALMLVGREGYVTGTIGGGMLEYECIGLAKEDLKEKKGGVRQYRLTKESAAGLGMVCGGDVDVLFSYVDSQDKNLETIEKMEQCLEKHTSGWIGLSLDGSDLIFVDKAPLENTHYYFKEIGNLSRVYIFGGGHLAKELVPVLAHLGFRCVVTDDREDFSTPELFPQAEEVYTCNFDALEGKYPIESQDYIIAMTRGHLGDMDVEKFALKTEAHYIGVVGSRKKTAAVNEALRACGFETSDIERIVTPIGLDIYSDTPAEIAISIAAQLIKDRALYRMEKRG